MTHETPAQRRTRLIEQYAGQIYARGMDYIDDANLKASKLADAVIAATPQEPEPTLEQQLKTARLEVEAETLRCAEPTRYPSEIETLLHSALIDVARALERRCYRTATKKAKDALAKVPSSIFDV